MHKHLVIRVNPIGWQLKQNRDSNVFLSAMIPKTMARDNYRCVFCGYSAPMGMQVINLDGNYNNNNLDNMATACSLCSRSVFIGSFQHQESEESKIDKIIYLPEISQVQIHHLLRFLFTMMSDEKSEKKDIAELIYSALRKRSKDLESIFGKRTSDARVFAQSVMDANLYNSKNMSEIRKFIRYLPVIDSFKQEITFWHKNLNEKIQNLNEIFE